MNMEDIKTKLKMEFSKDFCRYYWVPLFDEYGYERHICEKCGTVFWSVAGSKNENICPDPSCSSYSFIGSSNGKPMDYIETWKAIEKFFVKNGHTSIPSYPVIARWFPGMYFTLASIVAFQRSVHGKTVFEMPHDRIIIPQVCLRFNDIPNVGVTGRHMSNFIMVGQHSIFQKSRPHTYWKEKCVELDFELLNKVFKIQANDMKWVEDVWVGPNAFGYSLEYYVKGLELGNAVFTEFIGTPDNYKQMPQKVIDMGAGLERFCWYTQGTPTAYDAVYGNVIKKMKTFIDYDKNLFEKYSLIAGNLNMDEVDDIEKERTKIANALGISAQEMQKQIASLEGVYAITDHAKTLLYAIADGGLPSNVGGGYNLRVVLRRALGFLDKLNLQKQINLPKVCEWHAYYLKKLAPHLREHLGEVTEILNIEEKRYNATKNKSRKIVLHMLENREKIDDKKMTVLYESEGITPELIEEIADEKNIEIRIPDDFYTKLSEKHLKEKKVAKKIELDLKGLPATELLFMKNEKQLEFDAIILRIINNWVILDKTSFYAEAGGQDHDLGTINGLHVDDVQKFGDIVAHKVSNIGKLKTGMKARCSVDAGRRKQLTQHHTAVHLINASSRAVLGDHIWQGGSGKTVEKAHLDITHHSALTEKEVDEIELLANKLIQKSISVEKKIMPRQEAEAKYSMRIYQGGAVPDKNLRIVSIANGRKIIDAEACGGTHVDNTQEIDEIIITNTERIQDGLVRITIVAGDAAKKYREHENNIINECKKILHCKENELLKKTKELFSKWKKARKSTKKLVKIKSAELEKEVKDVVNVLDASAEELRAIAGKHKGIFFGTKDKSIIITVEDAGNIIKNMPDDLGVKGGGHKTFAQGCYEKKPNASDIKKIKKIIGLK